MATEAPLTDDDVVYVRPRSAVEEEEKSYMESGISQPFGHRGFACSYGMARIYYPEPKYVYVKAPPLETASVRKEPEGPKGEPGRSGPESDCSGHPPSPRGYEGPPGKDGSRGSCSGHPPSSERHGGPSGPSDGPCGIRCPFRTTGLLSKKIDNFDVLFSSALTSLPYMHGQIILPNSRTCDSTATIIYHRDDAIIDMDHLCIRDITVKKFVDSLLFILELHDSEMHIYSVVFDYYLDMNSPLSKYIRANIFTIPFHVVKFDK